jgi:putative ABC transport system permease protein
VRSLAALRALARAELRELRRNAWGSSLVLLLVAVPVAALVGGGALFETTQRTADEACAEVLGAAQLRVDSDVSAADLHALLLDIARVERVSIGAAELRVPGRKLAARGLTLPAHSLSSSGLARGMVRLTDGTAPEHADEIAVSPVLVRALSRSIGDTIETERGPARIVGIAVQPEELEMPLALRAPDPTSTPDGARGAWLIDVPDPAASARLLRAAGYRVVARDEIGEPDDFESTATFVAGGFGFFVAALVISAAFAVGLRRRQREIGLLGANGASIGDMRASIFASALVVASVGAAGGVAVGIAAARVLHPHFDAWNQRWNGDLELSSRHVVGAVALGLVATVSAAALPAFGATRLPIRVALSGRRPATEGTRIWLAVGGVLALGGLVLVAWSAALDGAPAAVGILAGSASVVLGLGACSPWLLGLLARSAARLPLAWRLAARDAGRFRARNGPVVTAVLAGMSVSLMVASLIGSVEALIGERPATLRPDQLVVEGAGAEDVARGVASDFDAVAVAPIASARADGEVVRVRAGSASGAEAGWLAVCDADALRAFGAATGAEALRAGRIVALFDRSPPGSEDSRPDAVELELGANRSAKGVAVVWIEVDEPAPVPRFFCGPDTLGRFEMETGPPPTAAVAPWMVRLRTVVDPTTLERARVRAAGTPGTTVDAALLHQRATGSILYAVLGLCFLTGIVVVLVATALSSVESAADARVLRSIGAAPSVLRANAAARAAYLALLGCVLAVPAGLIPSYGLVELARAKLAFQVPWTEIAVVVVGLPLLAFAAAWISAALERDPAGVRAARG